VVETTGFWKHVTELSHTAEMVELVVQHVVGVSWSILYGRNWWSGGMSRSWLQRDMYYGLEFPLREVAMLLRDWLRTPSGFHKWRPRTIKSVQPLPTAQWLFAWLAGCHKDSIRSSECVVQPKLEQKSTGKPRDRNDEDERTLGIHHEVCRYGETREREAVINVSEVLRCEESASYAACPSLCHHLRVMTVKIVSGVEPAYTHDSISPPPYPAPQNIGIVYEPSETNPARVENAW